MSRAALSAPGPLIRGEDIEFLHEPLAPTASTPGRLPTLRDNERAHIAVRPRRRRLEQARSRPRARHQPRHALPQDRGVRPRAVLRPPAPGARQRLAARPACATSPCPPGPTSSPRWRWARRCLAYAILADPPRQSVPVRRPPAAVERVVGVQGGAAARRPAARRCRCPTRSTSRRCCCSARRRRPRSR